MIEGIALVFIGTLIAFAGPAHDLVVHRRQEIDLEVAHLLVDAFPVPRPDAGLTDLVEAADAALLEHDALLRGVRGVTAIYTGAAGT